MRDARFDGRFFVGVTSTRIYCRPVCRVRTPRPDHCRYFGLAAQAEQAGFRPCLRCRPELAPADRHWSLHDAAERLIGHALQWLDDPAHGFTDEGGLRPLSQLARHLGVTDRHLRRLFAARLGMSPLQYLQTRRLLTAKLLLTDTPLPVGQVALISGFGSLRRFNDVFVQAYGMSPSKLRQPARSSLPPRTTMRPARLAWRPPMNVPALLGFLGQRLLRGNEQLITGPQPGILKAVALQHHGVAHAGWIRVRFSPDQACVLLDVGPSLLPLLPQVIWRVRHWLDLDTDIAVIDALLEPDFTGGSGMRVPGSFDGFETGVRAILGQQVSLGAANALARA
jgi:AraC family transcriptional regulator, regulatory protein of adaptative response / DNA-3-methyladenine glycosylase II